MRREHRHHRRSRKFLSVNEYSLYRNRIYLLNTLRAAQQNRTVRKELLEWFRRNEDELEIMDAFLMQEYYKAIPGRRSYRYETESSSSPEDPAQRKAAETQFMNASVKILNEKTRKAPSPSPIQTAAHLVVQHFSLKPIAGALLQLTYYYHIYHSTAHSLWDQLQDVAQGHIETTAILLGCSPEEVEDAFRELADVGITDLEDLSDRRTDPGDYTHPYFDRIWHPPVRDMDELMVRLIGQPCKATLDLKDFAHLDNRDNAVRILSAAIQERQKRKTASWHPSTRHAPDQRLRPGPRPRRHQSGDTGRTHGRPRHAPILALPVRTSGNGQNSFCALHRRTNGHRHPSQARVRPPEQIRRRKRAEHRIGLCRSPPDQRVSRLRRSGFAPHGPAICTTFLGSEPGQRIAQPDGAAPPPICLHHKPVGHHRPGSRTPLRISR